MNNPLSVPYKGNSYCILLIDVLVLIQLHLSLHSVYRNPCRVELFSIVRLGLC